MKTRSRSQNYFLKHVCRWVIKDCNLNLLGEYFVVGLGCGHETLSRHLEDPVNVSGLAKTIEVFTGFYKGVRVSTIAIPGGGVYTEWIVRIAALKPVKAIIGVGFCGALREDIEIGDIIIPTASARDEDTTDHYVSKKMPAISDFFIISTLTKHAMSKSLKFYVGPTITTSASLKEDDKFIAEWVGCKVLGVDCETSILYLLSHLYNIGAGAILVVSDHLIKRISYSISKEYEKRVQKAFNDVIIVALDTIADIS